MDGNFENNKRKRNRALIIRCNDPAWMELLDLIRQDSRWLLIYSKSSGLKLVVREEGF
jgi:hypothetical protein